MPSTISAGTTAGTAIAIAGDTTGNLAFQTNGTTTAMTIDTSQNVGIGTSGPTQALDIVRGSGDPAVRIGSAGGACFFVNRSSGQVEIINAANQPMLFSTNNIERMRIDSAGRVTTPFQPYIIAARTGSGFTTDSSNPIQFNTILNQVGITASNSNSRFTVPVAGTYLICFNWFLTSPSNLDNAMTVLVNGTEIYRFGTNSNGLSGTPSNYGDGAAQMYYFNANDYVDFRGSGAKTVLGTNPYHTTISIGKIY